MLHLWNGSYRIETLYWNFREVSPDILQRRRHRETIAEQVQRMEAFLGCERMDPGTLLDQGILLFGRGTCQIACIIRLTGCK